MAKPEKQSDRKMGEELLLSRPWSNSSPPGPNASTEEDAALTELRRKNEDFNERVHHALAEIPIPPRLRDQILAGRKIVPVPFWRTPRAIALAAALAFLATGLLFWATAPREDQTFAGFRSRMVGFALREYRMDIFSSDLASVRTFLAQNGAPSDFNLPPALANTPVKGGATLSWQGKPVSMVCFDRLNTTVYMFVIDHSAAGVEPREQVTPVKNLATATWISGDKTFLLAANLPIEELQRLVKS